MRPAVLFGLGLIGALGLGAIGLWLWGTMAFTPERIALVRSASGRFDDGLRWAIVSSQRGVRTVDHAVRIGLDAEPNLTVLFVAAASPVPVQVERPAPGALLVSFRGGAPAPIAIALDADGVPLELVSIAADGSQQRRKPEW